MIQQRIRIALAGVRLLYLISLLKLWEENLSFIIFKNINTIHSPVKRLQTLNPKLCDETLILTNPLKLAKHENQIMH